MFEPLNEFIKYINELGIAKTIYDLFHPIGFVALYLFVIWIGKKQDVKIGKTSLVVLIVYPVLYLWMYVLCWADTGFTTFGGNNIVRVFVYVPLLGLLASKILKLDWKKVLSILAFAPLVQHGVSHFACTISGCCSGHPVSWGIYNPTYEDLRIPMQPIEAIAAWIIIAILYHRLKKKKYQPDGLECPIMLVLFGSSRFVFEFFRDNNKLWLGCSSLAFHALFMCIVGIVWIVLHNKNKKKAMVAEVFAE